MKTTRWVIPQAKESGTRAARKAPGPAAVALGRPLRIGLLDNTKDNAHLLLALIGERVRSEFAARIVTLRKGNATVGADDALLDELAREADCVLTAMAD